MSYFKRIAEIMNQLDIIKAPIQQELATFQALYSDALKSDNALLNQVLVHLRNTKGKQMRPVLTLLVARLFGSVSQQAFNAAISLELLHTASLVHDDVVDESDKRRGLPSVNAVFNNKVAVLSGDYLLSSSLLYVSKTNLECVNIVSTLGQQLARGELLQLFNTTSTSFSEDSYFSVIRQKTASLFEACCMLGSICGNATQDQVEQCRKFGECVGLIFQIRDDIFDYYSKDVGKPTGNDMREGKLTLPAIYAINHSDDEEVREKALRIRSLTASEDEIQEFIQYVINSGGIDYARGVMAELHDKALRCIPESAPQDVIDGLKAYLNFVSDREI